MNSTALDWTGLPYQLRSYCGISLDLGPPGRGSWNKIWSDACLEEGREGGGRNGKYAQRSRYVPGARVCLGSASRRAPRHKVERSTSYTDARLAPNQGCSSRVPASPFTQLGAAGRRIMYQWNKTGAKKEGRARQVEGKGSEERERGTSWQRTILGRIGSFPTSVRPSVRPSAVAAQSPPPWAARPRLWALVSYDKK